MLPLLRRLTLACALPIAAPAHAQQPSPPAPANAEGWQQFFSRSQTFHLDVPSDWRQLSPVTARELRERFPDWPREVTAVEPTLFYAVGPVDRWLAGEFDRPFVYVTEQGNEWATDDDYAVKLAAMWREKGARDGIEYAITEIARATVGPTDHPVITCRRTIRGKGGPELHTFDVYAPTGGCQVSLVFCTPHGPWRTDDPGLKRMLSSLTFARKAKGPTKLSDRLWTPILTGAIVGLLLVYLYRRNRRAV